MGKKDLITINLNSTQLLKENKIKVSTRWKNKIKNNININTFPNYERKAISITNTNIENYPNK